MGALNNAFDSLVSALQAAGLTVASTDKQIRPGVVVVEPSNVTVSSINGRQRLLEIPVIVLAPPPGDVQAMRTMNDMADKVIDAVPATTANPGQYSANGNDMPCITVNVAWPAQS